MTAAELAIHKPIVLGPDEGTLVNLFGNPLLVRVPSEATGNKFWLAEYTIAPGFDGPPPHIHRRSHEVFYVLDGELGMLVGDKELILSPRSLAMVTPNTRHTFFNKGSASCRFLGLTPPGDLGTYLQAVPEIAAKYGFPPPPDVAGALAEQYDGGIFSPGD